MPGNKKPKKAYRPPSWIVADPVKHVTLRASKIGDDQLNRLRLRELVSIDSASRGHGDGEDLYMLIAITNMSYELSAQGVGPEAAPVCREAAGHIEKINDVLRAGAEFFTLDGAAHRAMVDVFEYLDLQRQSVSAAQYAGVVMRVTAFLANSMGREKNIKAKAKK